MKDSIVERRLRYIERQQKLGHGVNVRFEGLSPQGSGPLNRHGLPSIPIDQHVVHNWPVLDLGDIPNIPLPEWRLEISGLVENPVTLTWDAFMELPQTDDVSDFHCVTSWSRLGNHWRGVRFSALAELAVPLANATWVVCTGYDRDGDSGEWYTTNLPLARAVALALTGPGRFSIDALLGLGSLWTPPVVAGLLAAGVAGGILNLSLRRRPVVAS